MLRVWSDANKDGRGGRPSQGEGCEMNTPFLIERNFRTYPSKDIGRTVRQKRMDVPFLHYFPLCEDFLVQENIHVKYVCKNVTSGSFNASERRNVFLCRT